MCRLLTVDSAVLNFCSPSKEGRELSYSKDIIVKTKMEPKIKPQKNSNNFL